MARDLTSGIQAAVAAESSTVIRLLELTYSGGTLRWTTAPQDIEWDSETWTAVGGVLQIGGAQESGQDMRAEGVPVTLSGVDSSIISIIRTSQFRGRDVVVYRAHLADGAIIADPIEEFRGYQNDAYRITDSPDSEGLGGGTTTIRTRWVSRLAILQRTRAVRTNLHSHRDMLRRGGLTGTDLDDAFFAFLPKLDGTSIRWGSENPQRWGGGGSGSGRTDPDFDDPNVR